MASVFNLLSDRLPDNFYGTPIKTDFKTVLRFYKMAQSKALTEHEKNQITVDIFFGEQKPDDLHGFPEFLNSFLAGANPRKDMAGGKKVFDFSVDSGRIMAGFQQVYGIDLRQSDMHWWIFLEYLGALPDETMFRKVIEIRQKKPGNRSTPEQRAAIARSKAIFGLEEDQENAMNSLKNAMKF